MTDLYREGWLDAMTKRAPAHTAPVYLEGWDEGMRHRTHDAMNAISDLKAGKQRARALWQRIQSRQTACQVFGTK